LSSKLTKYLLINTIFIITLCGAKQSVSGLLHMHGSVSFLFEIAYIVILEGNFNMCLWNNRLTLVENKIFSKKFQRFIDFLEKK